ncbi:MAG: alpha/beta fold hydrolase [Candidatus Limnocylindrales bacterium]
MLRTAGRRSIVALATLSLVLGGCASALEGSGEFMDVPGGQIHVWCDGSGDGPTVVFLSAVGGDHSLVPIAERIQSDHRVCFYDRPGDNDTAPPDQPRDAASDAADLHELLGVAGIDGPVVLVGHSYGGLVALVAAADHPEDVAGMVLVDGSHPDAEAAMSEAMTEAQRAYFDDRMLNFPYVDWPTSLEQAGDAVPRIPDIPVTVLTATRSFLEPCDPALPCAELQEIWLDAQATYATLTSKTKQVMADTSHYVHDDDPDLVESEIRALLDQF